MPQNFMRVLRAVIRPDHFKFASYGPEVAVVNSQFTGSQQFYCAFV